MSKESSRKQRGRIIQMSNPRVSMKRVRTEHKQFSKTYQLSVVQK